jgi:uncharacterized protein
VRCYRLASNDLRGVLVRSGESTQVSPDGNGVRTVESSVVIMQPTTLCNLDCGYCYLPGRARRRTMTVEVSRATARTVDAWAKRRPVEVVWHGGEPLATGRTHLGKLMDCFATEGISHSVQTNATLVDEAWCEFFLSRGMRVGVSLDGAAVDNSARVDRRGRPMFDRIVRGIRMLIDAGIEVAVIAVVSDPTPRRAHRLYRTVAELGCCWLGVNIEEQEGVNLRVNRHPPGRVREFWAALTEAWEHDRRVQLRDVDAVLAYAGRILTAPFSGDSVPMIDPMPTVAYDGMVTLISPELAGFSGERWGTFGCGTVVEEPLAELIDRGLRAPWIQEFFSGLRACVRTCAYFDFCGGAHPANRFFEHGRFDGTETNYCRNSRIALLEGVLDHAGRVAAVDRPNSCL